MNKILMSSLLAMLIFSGCDDSEITSYEDNNDDTEYDTDERSENDDDTSGSYITHNQGVACLTCHSFSAPNGAIAYFSDDNDNDDDEDEYPDYDEKFYSGGTVYTTISGNITDEYASSYTLRVLLDNNVAINYKYDSEGGTANSYSEDTALTSSYTFTAQVINSNGEIVNSSSTNSHKTETHLDCNSCHTANGTDGAPGRITSYDYYSSLQSVVTETNTTTTLETNTTTVIETNTTTTPETNTTTVITNTVSFASAVMPVLENKCKTCHTVGRVFLVSDTASTYTNIEINAYTNTTNVDSSSLLTKATGVNHGGGLILNTTDVEYQTLKDWITQGALNN